MRQLLLTVLVGLLVCMSVPVCVSADTDAPGGTSRISSMSGPSDWLTFQGNYLHTGYNDKDQISLPITRSWWRRVYTGRIHPVTVIGNHLIVSSYIIDWYDDIPSVKCLDARTGFYSWQHVVGSWARIMDVSQVSYADGYVFYQVSNMDDSFLRKANLVTGEVVWDAPFLSQAAEFLAPAVSNGKVVMNGGLWGGMYGFDAETGEYCWFERLGWYDKWTPAIHRDTAYTFISGIVRAWDIHTGEFFWELFVPPDSGRSAEMSGSLRTAPTLDTTRRILYCNSYNIIVAVDLDSREFLWRRRGLHGHLFWGISLALHDGVIYTVDTGKLVALDGLTGDLLWQMAGDEPFCYHPVGANGLIFASSYTQTVAVDLLLGEQVWSCDVGGHLSIANNTLYIADSTGTVNLYKGAPVETGVNPSPELPDNYQLDQNFPNPFNPSTTIEFTLPTRSHVLLMIYDVLGREVITLANQRMSVGQHTVTWSGADFSGEPVATGTYFYRLTTDSYSETKKMILLK